MGNLALEFGVSNWFLHGNGDALLFDLTILAAGDCRYDSFDQLISCRLERARAAELTSCDLLQPRRPDTDSKHGREPWGQTVGSGRAAQSGGPRGFSATPISDGGLLGLPRLRLQYPVVAPVLPGITKRSVDHSCRNARPCRSVKLIRLWQPENVLPCSYLPFKPSFVHTLLAHGDLDLRGQASSVRTDLGARQPCSSGDGPHAGAAITPSSLLGSFLCSGMPTARDHVR